MTVRYFVPELPRGGGKVQLPETESHHASTVMRIRPGATVTLFDGIGHEAVATIQSVSRRAVDCAAAPAKFEPRNNPRRVTLAVAMPKGDRSKELIERLTELGIERVVPIHCQRSAWAISDAALLKWQRVMIEACKQSHRNRLMEIVPPVQLIDFISVTRGEDELAWLAHPGGEAVRLADVDWRTSNGRDHSSTPAVTKNRPSVQVAIGPEGGFSDEEAAAAIRAGWTLVGLGERIYRIETAAIILAIKAAGI